MEQNANIINEAIKGSFAIIEQKREIEIIDRRFGINHPKETLEQIGDMLNITRERVRQLEKAILVRLRVNADEGNIAELPAAEKILVRNLTEMGRVARLTDLADRIYGHKSTDEEQAALYFIANISNVLTLVDENDNRYAAVGIAEYGDEEKILARVKEIVDLIKTFKEPVTLDQLDAKLNYEHPDHIRAIASISKKLATLNGLWGLASWPSVNPKNIRDKIFVVLNTNQSPMHFSDIAKAISESSFQRKNVTVQAIHNELIKDSRFVLIGRGIYALEAWGYTRGTVSETIVEVLKEAGEPLTREEIVKNVLHRRKVKETTILLNLQDRKLFKRVDKNKYTIA